MAGPWHPWDMVNNSHDVTFGPRQRLAVWRLTGHSAENRRSWSDLGRCRYQHSNQPGQRPESAHIL